MMLIVTPGGRLRDLDMVTVAGMVDDMGVC